MNVAEHFRKMSLPDKLNEYSRIPLVPGRRLLLAAILDDLRGLLVPWGVSLSSLHDLSKALCDLNLGTLPPLFERDRVPHRAADSGWKLNLIAAASVAMTLLKDCGLTKPEASLKVCRILRPYFSKHIKSPTTIAKWREKCMKYPKTKLGKQYWKLLKTAKANSPNLEVAAKKLLEGLPSALGHARSDERKKS